ncbi:hypothetical protein [Pseudomonas aeruginosa]|uniref:hypothetical protein n=1 Tax=Pseudomonas aeruginosa TaxID=287 RepID=UPI0015C66CD0|nr:hypothetical protein [Pseudomonas aeruginosa]
MSALMSVRAIAAQMGVSVGAVSGYLKTGEGVQSPSVLQAQAADLASIAGSGEGGRHA